jgi:hypothetical protein
MFQKLLERKDSLSIFSLFSLFSLLASGMQELSLPYRQQDGND